MNYIVDSLDLAGLLFGPADVHAKEISYRQVAGEVHREQFWWLLKQPSDLKERLGAERLEIAFETAKDHAHPETVGFNKDDRIIVVIEAPDSHLFVAQTGFRFFLVTFEKRNMPVPQVTE